MLRLFIKMSFVLLLSNTEAKSQKADGQLRHPKPPGNAFSKNFRDRFTRDINQAVPSIGSFIICRKDSIVYKNFFHGGTDSTLFNVKSITKSILSALAGIAKEKGLLPGLETPVLEILTDYKPKPYPENVWFAGTRIQNDSIRQRLTLKDLLSMQTGLQWDDFSPVATAFVLSSDPVRFMLDIPFEEDPGKIFNYCSGASTLLGAVLSKVVNSDLKGFANDNLFYPTGVRLTKWDTDPAGRYVGASEMYLTANDLVQFGLLYLHKGSSNNKQVLSSAWIQETFQAHAVLNQWPVLPNANGYGFYWWRRKSSGLQCYVASGAGGQLLYVIPGLDTVIVTTCFLTEKNRGRSELKLLHSFVDKVIKELSLQ